MSPGIYSTTLSVQEINALLNALLQINVDSHRCILHLRQHLILTQYLQFYLVMSRNVS